MCTLRSEIGVRHSIPSFGLGSNTTDETHHSSFGRDCSGEVETVRFRVAREKTTNCARCFGEIVFFLGGGAQVCIYGHARAKPGVATSCIWYLRT